MRLLNLPHLLPMACIADRRSQKKSSCPALAIGRRALMRGIRNYQHYQFDKAIENFETALRRYTQIQDAIGIGKSLNGLSAVYLQTHKYRRSLSYSQAAISILEDTAANQDYALAVYHLGISHFKVHNLYPAEQCVEALLGASKTTPATTDVIAIPPHPKAMAACTDSLGTNP
jgi:tetratricopeptide (TPR) repeat protein